MDSNFQSEAPNARDFLFRGHFQSAVTKLVRQGSGIFDRDEAPYSLGAMCLSGQPQQAEAILKEKAKTFSPEELVMCRYFLAVGYTMAGRHKRARRYIAGNFGKRLSCRDPKSQFFMWQGLAFYRFYSGRMRQGLRAAQKSFEFALMTDFAYGRMVAAEVKGHLLYLTGKHQQGLESLEHAANFARSLQNALVLKSVSLALATYESRSQTDEKKAVKKLREVIKALPQGDRFAESSLRLEISRQLTKSGQLKASRKELDGVQRLLFRQSHYRYDSILSIRFADWHDANGDFWEALLHTNYALKSLDETTDPLILVEAQMRRTKILASLGLKDAYKQSLAKVSRLSQQTGDYGSQRFLEDPKALAKKEKAAPIKCNVNHRQIQILRHLEDHEFIDVSEAKEMFGVSEITACRDLSSLTKKEMVVRVGKARATRYTKGQQTVEG